MIRERPPLMTSQFNIGIIFIALSVIFVGLAFQNYLRSEEKLTAKRKTWLRIAFIFSGIGILLNAIYLFT
jgi:heme A synthase